MLKWFGKGQETTVREALVAAGVDDDTIAAADASGAIELLAVEHLVIEGEPNRTMEEFAAEIELPVEFIQHFWRALGFPDPNADDPVFNDEDRDNIRATVELIQTGVVEPELALQMTRVVGSSMQRVAAAQVEAVLDRRGREETDPGDEPFHTRAQLVLELMPRLMEHVWRHHLVLEARRRMLQLGGAGESTQTVGFADLVGFTAVSQQVPDEELAHIVDRFESVAYDTVARHGGRVIKMIGDEVMYAVRDPAAAVEIGLAMADSLHGEQAISDVRVGLASGPVLEREGDLYGPTVNLASRIAGIAYPGAVVISESIRDALEDSEALVLHPLRAHTLKDIGKVKLWAVRRAGEEKSLLEAARMRRQIGRTWIEERFG